MQAQSLERISGVQLHVSQSKDEGGNIMNAYIPIVP